MSTLNEDEPARVAMYDGRQFQMIRHKTLNVCEKLLRGAEFDPTNFGLQGRRSTY